MTSSALFPFAHKEEKPQSLLPVVQKEAGFLLLLPFSLCTLRWPFLKNCSVTASLARSVFATASAAARMAVV